MNTDSKKRYGRISIFLHWSMALLITWQLLKFADRISDGEHWVGQTLVPWHVSIGILLLVLIVLRLLWVAMQRHQRPTQDPTTAKLVTAGHSLLYACMLLMPLTGIMVMLGGGYGITAFGVELVTKGDELAWAATLGELHSPLAWLLAALIIGHTAMALIHHYVRKDNTLTRML